MTNPDLPLIRCQADLESMKFAEFLGHITGGAARGTRWAILRSRGGGSGIDEVDRQWAGALYSAAGGADVPLDVIHLATDETLVPIPLDEVTGYLRAS